VAPQRKDEDEPRKERVIFLLTKKELEAIDEVANEKYFGNRSILIREALIDFGVIKKSR
jgi:metal-responsive CopG/Arc/MetJ family transcriptional regulator